MRLKLTINASQSVSLSVWLSVYLGPYQILLSIEPNHCSQNHNNFVFVNPILRQLSNLILLTMVLCIYRIYNYFAGWPIQGSIQDRGDISPQVSNGLWGPTSLIYKAKKVLFWDENGRGLKLTTYIHEVWRLRINGAIPLLPLYTCVAWTGTYLTFTNVHTAALPDYVL